MNETQEPSTAAVATQIGEAYRAGQMSVIEVIEDELVTRYGHLTDSADDLRALLALAGIALRLRARGFHASLPNHGRMRGAWS